MARMLEVSQAKSAVANTESQRPVYETLVEQSIHTRDWGSLIKSKNESPLSA